MARLKWHADQQRRKPSLSIHDERDRDERDIAARWLTRHDGRQMGRPIVRRRVIVRRS